MSQPTTLAGLTPREAIADAMYRCVIGLDTADLPLFESAWSKDSPVLFDMGTGAMHGLEDIKSKLYNFIAPLDTHHNCSNVRIDAKPGAKTAYLTAYSIAQHHRAGEGVDTSTKHLTSGAQYFLDVVEDGDRVWRIKEWRMTVMWLDGDASIVGR
ncbi:hypothetical protein M409DRAFT_22450 [Zasmidium cellare ATCC 36951]|uniref:SnoaL-like domain-containing protein n=1 Tax=Zasmidium cellare ATCC 36951 TaxID=1080233 RepID=A0A6A6CIZ7_ZASCE|nr:uncharacterized protein M409DRAFT_22450 [Zasmidium cellare ATCC 36951]KAF2167011.1 hypothetical protein M409DRAFT_22450 [Zasmidium cellare ATCC 36951]